MINDRQYRALAVSVAVLASAITGCNFMGYAAHVVGGDKVKQSTVVAEYRGLANQTVAVLVAADNQTLFRHPGADSNLCRAISARLANDVEGAKLLSPDAVVRFKRQNPYWNAMPYGELANRLGVSRLLYVDVVHYTTREHGNAHVWRGVISANIGVAEADGERPNDFVYASTLQTQFPPDRPVGLLDSDNATIELGMLSLFSQQVADLFHTHEVQIRQ